MKAQMEPTVNLALALEGTAMPASDEVKRLAGVADMLETLPDPDIDPRFVARLEAVLMAEFDARQPAPAAGPALRLVKPESIQEQPEQVEQQAPNVIALPRRRFVMRKAVAAMAAAAMLSALPVVAAASSMPGSPFFGIERFRQNHAISSAVGAEKGFAMEKVARKWIGYGAEMVALDYPADKLSGVLSHAGRLQLRAVRLIAAFGSSAEISRFTQMLEADVSRLTQIRDLANSQAVPAIERAIRIATSLSARLADGLAKGQTKVSMLTGLTLDGIVEASKPSDSGSKSAGDGKGKTGAGPKDNKDDGNDQFKQYWKPVEEECATLFEAELGTALRKASLAQCKIWDAIGGGK